jgi:pSer/pThr/pTyr-binding forkhead associated (FHA) protein
MARLIVTAANGDRTVDLAPGEVVTVGRDPSNRLAFPDESRASRRHCRIGPREDRSPGWELVDLGSTNKTRVNGSVADRRALTHGDVVEVGAVRIVFEDPEEAGQLAAAEKQGICYLEWVNKERKGQRVLLSAPTTTLGRRPSNTVPLDDRMASGHHAEIVRDLNGYTIRDLGSTNGTMVNGEPISEALLSHGARVRVGNSRFAFKDPSMKDVEVELSQFEEDEGWGMMGEIDLSRARGGAGGLLAALVILAAAVGAGFVLMQPGTGGGSAAVETGEVENGSFEAFLDPSVTGAGREAVLLWSAATEDLARVEVRARQPQGHELQLAHAADEAVGPVLVTYGSVFETVGSRPFRFVASFRGSGEPPPEYVVVWSSNPTPEELKSGRTAFQRTEVLARGGRGWTVIEERRIPPRWARTARIGVLLPPGSRAALDDVNLMIERGGAPHPTVRVAGGREAGFDTSGALDLFDLGTLLLGGVSPVAVAQDGTALTGFRAREVRLSDGGVEVSGAFPGEEGEVPATVRWSTGEEGLRAEVACPGSSRVGLGAQLVAESLEGALNALGDFAPQSLGAEPGARLERVARILAGDRDTRPNRPDTLINLVVGGGRPEGTLELHESRDPGLLGLSLTVPGERAVLEVVTDFERQRERALGDLARARALLATAPGRAIASLRQVALEYPFEESVRDEALRLASEREDRTRQELDALEEALQAFRIFGSRDALASVDEKTSRLEGLFLGPGHPSGPLETRLAELVRAAGEARRAWAVEQAEQEVDRMQRLFGLLAADEGYRPLAVLYARSLLDRFGDLAGHTPDLQRRLDLVRAQLDEIVADPAVQRAIPPPPRPGD